MIEVVHLAPPDGWEVVPCCYRAPLDLPLHHRMTDDRRSVTCARTWIVKAKARPHGRDDGFPIGLLVLSLDGDRPEGYRVLSTGVMRDLKLDWHDLKPLAPVDVRHLLGHLGAWLAATN